MYYFGNQLVLKEKTFKKDKAGQPLSCINYPCLDVNKHLIKISV